MSADTGSTGLKPEGFPFYQGPRHGEERVLRPASPLVVRSINRAGLEDPALYRPAPDLEAAVNTALLLGMPLIVTGEPGCGKTQLGEAVAHALGIDWERFETKSTSVARDLFYEFDVVGRFQARETGSSAEAGQFIQYRALGKAILLAHSKPTVEKLLPSHDLAFHPGPASRRVVMIDEIDKAPRDFPNDILNEIDNMYFRVPELGAEGLDGTPPSIPPELRPIVILTSNSEKKLPDAFLRRCVFFHIPSPSADQLRQIVRARLGQHLGLSPGQGLGRTGVEDALSFFVFVRDPRRNLGKRPGIAELLNWLQALAGHDVDFDAPLASQSAMQSTMTALLKTSEDAARAKPSADRSGQSLLEQWLADPVVQRARQESGQHNVKA